MVEGICLLRGFALISSSCYLAKELVVSGFQLEDDAAHVVSQTRPHVTLTMTEVKMSARHKARYGVFVHRLWQT
jgi:hypothetical protein